MNACFHLFVAQMILKETLLLLQHFRIISGPDPDETLMGHLQLTELGLNNI